MRSSLISLTYSVGMQWGPSVCQELEWIQRRPRHWFQNAQCNGISKIIWKQGWERQALHVQAPANASSPVSSHTSLQPLRSFWTKLEAHSRPWVILLQLLPLPGRWYLKSWWFRFKLKHYLSRKVGDPINELYLNKTFKTRSSLTTPLTLATQKFSIRSSLFKWTSEDLSSLTLRLLLFPHFCWYRVISREKSKLFILSYAWLYSQDLKSL